jgi:Carbohydrate binding module (family 6)
MKRTRSQSRRRALLAAVAAFVPIAALAAVVSLPTSALATTVPAPPTGMSTVYSDSFSGAAGTGVDSSWTYDIGTQYNGAGCTSQWGTGEVESNTNSTANVALDGSGHLNITPVDTNGAWTSGRIETTADNYEAPAGGEMEVSALIKQPNPSSGVGYWPAFWLLGAGFRASGAGTSGSMTCSNWPSVGELDTMEDVNALSEHSATLHCGVDPGGACNETTGISSGLQACSGCQTGYNTYSVLVNRTNTSAESISYLLNGTVFYTINESQVPTATWQAAVDHGFFIILDVAIGGAYPNAICGCTSPSSTISSGAAMSVGYVAVYETSGTTTPPTTTPPTTTPPTTTPPTTTPPTTTPPTTTPPTGSGTCTTTATSDISADCYKSSQGTITVSAATGDTNPAGVDGNQTAQLKSGEWLEYPGINFGTTGSRQFDARVASGAAGGVSGLVNVVLDSPTNAPIGSFAVANTGGWSTWETVPANINQTTGTHNVYLEFSSGATGNPSYVSLHYFNFPVS